MEVILGNYPRDTNQIYKMKTTETTTGFPPKAQAALNTFYAEFGSTTDVQKIRALETAIGERGQVNHSEPGSDENNATLRAVMEYEFLHSRGLIEIELA